MTDRNEQVRAVFLAAIMVLSMVAMGATAIGGTAIADEEPDEDGDEVSVANTDVNVTYGANEVLATSFDQQNELNLTEIGAGSSGTAEVTFNTVSLNETGTDLSIREVKNGQISNVNLDAANDSITFDYSSFSGSNDRVTFGQVSVDVDLEGGNSFDIDGRVGAQQSTQSVTTNEPTISGADGDNVAAGQDQQAVTSTNDLKINNTNVDGQIGAGTDIVIKTKSSDGITFDQSQDPTSLSYAGATGNINTSGASYTSSDTLEIPVDSEFAEDENLTITSGTPLRVNVSGDAVDSELTVETESTNSLGTQSGETGTFSITKPSLGLIGENLARGLDRQPSGGVGALNITTSAENQIQNGQQIIVEQNNSDVVEFDRQASLSKDGANSSKIESAGNIAVNPTNITIDVTEDFNASDFVKIRGVQYNVSENASADTTVGLTMLTGANNNVSSVGNETYTVKEPTVDFAETTVTRSDVSDTTGVNVTEAVNVTANSDNNEIGDNTNITVSVPQNNGVSFDESGTVTTSNNGVGTVNTPVVINEYNFTVQVSSFSEGDDIGFANIPLNLTSGATNVTPTVTTETANGTTVTQDAPNKIVVDSSQPTLDFDDGLVRVDGDGEDQKELINTTSDAQDLQLNVTSQVDGDLANQSNVTVSIDSAGTDVNFDSAGLASDVTNDGLLVEDGQLTVRLTADAASGDTVTFENIDVNATDSATNASFTVTVGSDADDLDPGNKIQVDQVDPDQVRFRDTTSNPESGTTVTETVNATFDDSPIDSEAPFGSADIDLNVTDAPDAVSDPNSVLSTTSVTTGADGNATYDFTASETGDYTVEASSAVDSTVNDTFTYTVESGPVAEAQVTAEENALRAGLFDGTRSNLNDSDTVYTAVHKVELVDDQGNLYTEEDSSVKFQLTFQGGDDPQMVNIGYNLTDDGSLNHSQKIANRSESAPYLFETNQTVTEGTFYVLVDESQANDVTVEVRDDSDSSFTTGSATATHYSSVSSVDLTVGQTDIVRTTSETAEAVPKTSSGDTIQVPRIDVDFGTNDSNVASINGSSSLTVSTTKQGVASTSIDGESKGDAVIDVVTRNNRADDVNVSVTDPDLSIDLNVSSVPVNEKTFVEANVTSQTNQSGQQDATVNVTGAGVGVPDGTTDSNGTVTFNVTPDTAAEDIAVNATKTNFNPDEVSLPVDRDEIQLNITANSTDVIIDETVQFTVTRDDTGGAVENANISVDGTEIQTDANGEATYSFDSSGDFTATASKDDNSTETYLDDSVDISVSQDAQFEVSNLNADNSDFTDNDGATAVRGEDNLTITADIENTGENEDTQTVEFRFDGGTEATEDVTLAGGENTTVTFELTAPDVAAGTYEHGVYTDDDNATTTIDILPSVDVNGDNNAARDTTGDGLLDDVNGDATADIFDVQTFFDRYEDTSVQDNGQYFNFNGDSNDDVTLTDVQNLYNRIF